MTEARAIARRDAQPRENQSRYPGGFPPGQERLYGYDADAALAGGTRPRPEPSRLRRNADDHPLRHSPGAERLTPARRR